MYKELSSQIKYPELESEILKYWEENNIFGKSVESRPADNAFVFFEGPPTANGRPGIHHVISRAVKDLVCRLKTMEGYRVERKAGWDTHGLPVEIEVEKSLGFTNKEQIEQYGVDKFNAKCRESVWKYKTEWDELTRRIGFWVNLDDPYVTYENEYIESIWWILSEFWKKDLLYLGHKITPYCPRCETPLSSHEVSQGYQDVEDPSVYVKMPLKSEPGKTVFKVEFILLIRINSKLGPSGALAVQVTAWAGASWRRTAVGAGVPATPAAAGTQPSRGSRAPARPCRSTRRVCRSPASRLRRTACPSGTRRRTGRVRSAC